MIDTEKLCREFDLFAQAQRDTQLKKSGVYWIGPCPFCSGTDRFQLKTQGDITKWYCRGCGLDRYHDAIDYVMKRDTVDFFEACRRMATGSLENYETDPVKLAEFEQKRQAQAAQERRERERKLSEFSTRELGEEYHARLAEQNYQWWETQGIPRNWADWWKLGYMPEKTFKHGDTTYTRPAYTIPKFDFAWKPTNMDYRLVDPPPGVGKYRFETGLNLSVFLSRPDMENFPDEVLITEGSKKAMVASIYTFPEKQENMVIGVPSKSAWCGISERVKDLGRVWICLDPGAEREAVKLAEMIGKAARVLTLPFKIDDGFLDYNFSWNDLKAVMRWAN